MENEIDLSKVETYKLTRELRTRQGIKEYYCEPFEPYEIIIDGKEIKDTGPAIVFIVIN